MSAVSGTNRDYVLMSRSPTNHLWRTHDVIAISPKNGSLSDRAIEGKSAGYRILIQYMPESNRRMFRETGENWMVEIIHIKPYGQITSKTTPRGFKRFVHFKTLNDAKEYVLKLKRKIGG